MLKANETQGAQTVVITETSTNMLSSLVEQVVGADQIRDSGETLEVLPRIFLQHIVASGLNSDEKIKIFQKSMIPFYDIQTVSFVLGNKVRWVAGDRRRTEKDGYLVFTVYKHWDKIKEALDTKEELPTDLKELTIERVKEYIGTLHAEFAKRGIVDPYYEKVSAVIASALKDRNISESDHIALLHDQLLKQGQQKERDAFNNNLLSFIAQKFDAELYDYLDAFKKEKSLKYLLIAGGGIHNQQMRTSLLSQGYVIAKKVGVEVDDTSLSSLIMEKKGKLLTLLKTIKKDQPVKGVYTMLFGVHKSAKPKHVKRIKQCNKPRHYCRTIKRKSCCL